MKDDKRKNNGGHKAGRKPLPDSKKKIPVQVYKPADEVELLGGIAEARRISSEALDKEISKKKK